MKQAALYFQLALRAGTRVSEYLPSTKEAFLNDPIIQDAVCMRLQEMGENISKVRKYFPEVFEKHATDRWYDLIGLRNAISHTYTEINMPAVWKLANGGISEVMKQLRQLT